MNFSGRIKEDPGKRVISETNRIYVMCVVVFGVVEKEESEMRMEF